MEFRLQGSADCYANHDSNADTIIVEIAATSAEKAIQQARSEASKLQKDRGYDWMNLRLVEIREIWKIQYKPAQPFVPARAARAAKPEGFQEKLLGGAGN